MTDRLDIAATPVPALGGLDLRRVALVDLVLPFVTVIVLERWGAAPLAAYALAGLFPAGSVLLTWLARRGVDLIGVVVLVAIGSGIALAWLAGDARFALLRVAPAYALFGVACLASLPARRPLMFFVSRAFIAAADPARAAAFDARLALPGFRRVMRLLTLVWGSGALAAAALNASAAFLLPGRIAIVTEPIVAIGTVLALLAFTRAYVRRATRRNP